MAWGRLRLSLLQGVDLLLLVGEALCYQVDRSGSGGCWRVWRSGGCVLLGTAAIASSFSKDIRLSNYEMQIYRKLPNKFTGIRLDKVFELSLTI